VELFREFHSREADHVLEIPTVWSSPGERIGEALLIVYRSDKWGDGVHDYIHFFESTPAVYQMKRGEELGEVPKEVAFLGGLVELQILTPDNRVIDLGPQKTQGAPLDLPWVGGFLDDGAGRLVVLSSGDPADCLLIASDELKIEARGIVG